ncbi:unnamed protein product, partial [marine sediment metagenome]
MIEEILQLYGKVEICKEENNLFHMKITDGFDPGFKNVNELLTLINDKLCEKYSIVVK